MTAAAVRAGWRPVRAAAAIAALVLAGCGGGSSDPRDAFADTSPPPGLAERFHPPEGWAWGLAALGDGPVQRYGVAAPRVVSKGAVLILPDYGETAETWFETVRDLNGAGYTVWVLEGVGQGGSARLSMQRDLGEVERFDGDVAMARTMISQVIRPGAERPLILLGQGVGALVASRAAETGAAPAGLVLSAPACERGDDGGLLRRLGFGLVRASPGASWRRDGPDDRAGGRTHDAWRGAVTHAWQIANPDLRMGGPSLDWRAAFAGLRLQTLSGVGRIALPTLVLDAGRPSACIAISDALRQVIPDADRALELEDQRRRGPWIAAIEAFLAARLPPLPAPAHQPFQGR